MNMIPIQQDVTMSSREIAELCGKTTGHVNRDIEKMFDELKIDKSIYGFTYKDAQNRNRQEYRLDKTLTETLVLGYSVKLRYRVVKRLEELEQQAAKPVDLSDPATLMNLLTIHAEQNLESQKVIAEQAQTIESQGETVQAFDRIAKSEGSMCITDAAKTLQIPPRELFAFMKQNGWIYSRPGTSWLGYQSKINVGYLEHKVTDVRRDDGTSKTTTQVRVTPKGLAKLSKDLGLENEQSLI